MPGSESALPGVLYWKFRKSTPADGMAGRVQEASAVSRWPGAPAALDDGTMAAVHTSFGDRNRLKSRTSAEVLPSRIRTLTAFPKVVVLTTEMYVFQAFAPVDCTV